VKKRLLSVLVVGLLAVMALGASPADADRREVRVPTFDNCRQLHRRWEFGVAKTRRAARRQVATGHHRPHVSRAGYLANDHLDADNDRTACEVLK
jgi:hypothetical protein